MIETLFLALFSTTFMVATRGIDKQEFVNFIKGFNSSSTISQNCVLVVMNFTLGFLKCSLSWFHLFTQYFKHIRSCVLCSKVSEYLAH